MLKFINIMIGSEDADGLSRFYTKVLGNPTMDEGDGGFKSWQLGEAGISIGPHSEVKGRSETPGRIIWNLETSDVQGEFDRIKGLGAKVVKEPYNPGSEEEYPGFLMATFEDPDGNYFQLTTPMPQM